MRPRKVLNPPTPVRVTARGNVSPAEAAYAEEKLGQIQHYTEEPVLSTRVVLTVSGDPARERPALAEASIDFDAVQVRSQAAAGDVEAAVDLVTNRLRRCLVQHEDRKHTRHRWIAAHAEHEWRHGSLPAEPVDHFPRPVEEREVVRRKTFALEPMTVDEAAFDMDLLGHTFYLFHDLDSDTDALVYRQPHNGYAVRGELKPPAGTVVKVAHEGPAPVLDEGAARTRLELGGEPFVFYLDQATGRGRVLYLRYDGHYGLIEAA